MSVALKTALMVGGIMTSSLALCIRVNTWTYEIMWRQHKWMVALLCVTKLAMLVSGLAMMAWAVFS